MPFLKIACPKCNAPAETTREFQIANKNVSLLKCGHILEKAQLQNCSSPEQIVSTDGKRLYKFQCDGVRFIERASGRALVGDEMGLGKTIQASGFLALHEELWPFLWVGKASLKRQYQYELMRWIGEKCITQVLDSPKDTPLGTPGYIMSYDIIPRFAKSATKKGKDKLSYNTSYRDRLLTDSSGALTPEIVDPRESPITNDFTEGPQQTELSKQRDYIKDLVTRMKIKTVILDECQQIKNHESQRAVFVREVCKHVDNIIALSGTPIKNNAAEYFSILNILKPEMFPKFATFLQKETDSYFNGYGFKTGGLKNPDLFHAKTKTFIIRRTRKEVMPDLPPIVRDFEFHELSEIVEKEYIETFKKFREDYNDPSERAAFERETNTLAYLNKMRHLVGLSKIDPCIENVMDLMESTEDRVTVFVHHKDVVEILTNKLNKRLAELNIPPCARHEAGDESLATEAAFAKTRVLICSTLAGGEGLNLQKLCSRFRMLERQWNPANEEQAEARFPRPEGLKVDAIEGVYFVATGTVDEMFSEIVEHKRAIVAGTLDNKKIEWDQSSIMKELAEILATTGGKRWKI